MICPKCGKNASLKHTARKFTTAAGISAGGYVAATTGGKTGAIIGSFISPGFGTVIGGILGVLIGAASGAAVGNTIGRLIDENLLRYWVCESCGHTWRSA